MQWSRRETKTLKLQQATEELGRERTARVTTMACMVLDCSKPHSGANRSREIWSRIERAHASTPLSMALNLIFAIRSSCRRHGGD